MSNQLITNYFRLHNANQFRESVSETANSVYYVFAGYHSTYPSGDSVIPEITNTVDAGFYDPLQETVFGKRVTPSDVAILTSRYNWTTNTYYSAYRSGDILTDAQYYVCVDGGASFHVFKCLDNNANTVSTIEPDVTQTSPDDEYYSTSDGYVWKYMYSVDSATFNKFATTDYMPVVANNQVVGNAVSGSIDSVVVSFKGSNYNTFLTNTFISTDLRVGGDPLKYNIASTANPANNFYTGSFLYIVNGLGYGQGREIVTYLASGVSKTITIATPFDVALDVTSQYQITPAVRISGNGDGATARALVNTSLSNTVTGVEILTRGSGYTYATAVVVGNTGGITNTAILDVVMGPSGGHGSNPEYELGASAVGVSVTFANSEVGTIPVSNDFRMVGLLKDPLYANVVLTVGSPTASFVVGEAVLQANTGATGVVTEWDSISSLSLTDVAGIFLTGNTTVKYITGNTSGATGSVSTYMNNGVSKGFDTFNQLSRFTFTPVYGTFQADESVYQTDVSVANAVFHSNSASTIYLSHINGTINTGNTITGITSGATANLTFAYPPDLVVGSGEVLYIENGSKITRSNTQSEQIKLVLQF